MIALFLAHLPPFVYLVLADADRGDPVLLPALPVADALRP